MWLWAVLECEGDHHIQKSIEKLPATHSSGTSSLPLLLWPERLSEDYSGVFPRRETTSQKDSCSKRHSLSFNFFWLLLYNDNSNKILSLSCYMIEYFLPREMFFHTVIHEPCKQWWKNAHKLWYNMSSYRFIKYLFFTAQCCWQLCILTAETLIHK